MCVCTHVDCCHSIDSVKALSKDYSTMWECGSAWASRCGCVNLD